MISITVGSRNQTWIRGAAKKEGGWRTIQEKSWTQIKGNWGV